MLYDEDIILARNLLALGLIDKTKHDKFLKVLKESQQRGCSEILSEEFDLADNIVQQTIATSFDIPEVTINEGDKTVKDNIISNSTCQKHRIIPLSMVGMELTIAFVDPPYKSLIDILKQESKRVIIPIVISLSNYRDLFQVAKGRKEETISLAGKLNIRQFDLRVMGKEKLIEAQRTGKLPSYDMLVEEIIIQAIKDGANDIHFEPTEYELRLRIDKDGILTRLVSFPREFAENFGNILKTKAGLNAFEKKKPQQGAYSATIGPNTADIRVSTLPTIHGERITVRIFLKLGILKPLDDIGFSSVDLNKLSYLLSKPSGLIIISGPAGSGKSTSLYAIINELNLPDKNILTVEDSIEFKLDFGGQVQAGIDKSLNFAEALRAILRQRPNVVLVSEIRDAETGIVAAEAALTGNLVLSTMLSSNTIETIPRLLHLGIPAYWLAPTLSGIVYQQLVRTICVKCKESYKPSKEELNRLGIFGDFPNLLLYRGKGCNECAGDGYSGRTTIHEILIINDMLKDLIYQNAPIMKMKEIAKQSGFKSIRYSALQKVLLGFTTSSEILRVLG